MVSGGLTGFVRGALASRTRLANVRYLALPSAMADLTLRQEDVLSNIQPAACTLGPSALLAVYFY